MSTLNKSELADLIDTLLAVDMNRLYYEYWQELHPEEDKLPLNVEEANQRIAEGKTEYEKVLSYYTRKVGGKRRTRRGNKSARKQRRKNTRRRR